jgi:hypothetical protein
VPIVDVVAMELDEAHLELFRPLAGRRGLGMPFWPILSVCVKGLNGG